MLPEKGGGEVGRACGIEMSRKEGRVGKGRNVLPTL